MYRAVKFLMASAALVSPFIAPQADAAWFGYPRALKSQLGRIGFQTPTAASPVSTNFWVRKGDNCPVPQKSFCKSSGGTRIGADQGDSNDFILIKRDDPQVCSWPSSTRLLTETIRREHHLLFVVHTGTQNQWTLQSIASQS